METVETPGMRRWESGKHRYYIRWAQALTGGNTYRTLEGAVYNVPDTKSFILGEEVFSHATNKYQHVRGVEYNTSEALPLLDQITAFHGMPTYTAQLQRWSLLEDLLDSADATTVPENFIQKIRSILKENK